MLEEGSQRKSQETGAAPLEPAEIMSFRDQLVKSNDTVKSSLSSDTSSCGGTTSDGSASFDLEWERTSNGWKIVAIPYL
jgi:hypothetical protein